MKRFAIPKFILVSLSSAVFLAVVATSAAAGTITGTLTEEGSGAAVSGVEVRAWLVTNKGLTMAGSTTSDAGGVYTLTVPAGTYKVDARGAPTYTDRWHDMAAPVSDGYVSANADELVVSASGTVSGVDVRMEVGGGGDGRVVLSGSGLGGPVVRMERKLDHRIHHNDLSDGAPVNGRYSFRGMPPASDYQMMIYDPTGLRDTALIPGPFTVSPGAVADYGDRAVVSMIPDPYEGNNAGNCFNTLVDESLLHADPPMPWQTNNAYIGPRGNDPDWYCFQAVDGDRLLITATTAFVFDAVMRYHPWTDPVMAWWQSTGAVKLAEDDDSGPGFFDPYIDTGEIDAGCYCLSVSTFGDGDYNGSGQGSAGRYTLTFEMGNRPPVVKVFKGATEVPYAPSVLTIAEGQELALTLEYPDADHDPLSTSFSHADSSDTPVTTGSLNMGIDGGDYTWMAGPTSALGSPYTITLQAADAEFDRTRVISLVVTETNEPPERPTLVSPIEGAVTMLSTPDLTLANATDPDGDALSYDIELYYDGTDGGAVQTTRQVEGAGGQTVWTVSAPIPENTRVYWRARANDGNGGISAWTDFAEFLVDTANDPPDPPILTKPSNGELVLVRRPGLAVINVTDPESEAVDFIYEIATNSDFSNVIWESAPVPMNQVSSTTMTVTDQDMDWGRIYFARAKARDARGAESEYSNGHRFQIKENLAPGAPSFANGCTPQTYTESLPTFYEVTNVVDPESEVVTFELLVYRYDDDPETTGPVIGARQEMSNLAVTRIEFDASTLENGRYRVRIHADDGTDISGWIECEFTLDLAEIMADAAGGCCQTGAASTLAPLDASLFLGVIFLALVMRRRVRPSGAVVASRA